MVFSEQRIRGYLISIHFITGDINHDQLGKVVSAAFFYYEFMLPSVTNKCLWIDTLRLGNGAVLHYIVSY